MLKGRDVCGVDRIEERLHKLQRLFHDPSGRGRERKNNKDVINLDDRGLCKDGQRCEL